MRKLRFSAIAFVCLGLLAGASLAQEKAAKKGKKAAILWPASDIKWTEVKQIKGAQMAVLWGNPEKGAYGALEKWPAGTDTPMHTHTYDSKGVIVSGTLVLTMEGESPTELGPGSYVLVPGGARHTTSCKAGADCTFFLEQPGKGDFKPVEGAAAKEKKM